MSNFYQWLVPNPRQLFHYHHDAGDAEQRLQPIHLHSDLSKVQKGLSESVSMVTV